jgi:hypothetical protein
VAEHFRTVVREHLFEDSLRALIADEVEADDFIASAETVLSVDPEAGIPIERGSPVWALKMPPTEREDVTLYYTFDAEIVRLLFIGRD